VGTPWKEKYAHVGFFETMMTQFSYFALHVMMFAVQLY